MTNITFTKPNGLTTLIERPSEVPYDAEGQIAIRYAPAQRMGAYLAGWLYPPKTQSGLTAVLASADLCYASPIEVDPTKVSAVIGVIEEFSGIRAQLSNADELLQRLFDDVWRCMKTPFGIQRISDWTGVRYPGPKDAVGFVSEAAHEWLRMPSIQADYQHEVEVAYFDALMDGADHLLQCNKSDLIRSHEKLGLAKLINQNGTFYIFSDLLDCNAMKRLLREAQGAAIQGASVALTVQDERQKRLAVELLRGEKCGPVVIVGSVSDAMRYTHVFNYEGEI